MSLKDRLRVVMVCVVLQFGVLSGVPMAGDNETRSDSLTEAPRLGGQVAATRHDQAPDSHPNS